MGFYVKGSAPFFDWNQDSLNFYIAEAESCQPCSDSGDIHGGVSVPATTPISYTLQAGTNEPPVIQDYGGTFIVPYSSGGRDTTFTFLPQPSELIIDDVKKGISFSNRTVLTQLPTLIRGIGESVEDSLKNYVKTFNFENPVTSGRKYIRITVDGIQENLKFCDCFNSKLYTSETKTRDENYRAVILQYVCDRWKPGVNAHHINWKPNRFMGRHDTSYSVDSPHRIISPGEYGNLTFLESGKADGNPYGPSPNQHATTFFLPKSLQQYNLTNPTMLFIKSVLGRFNDSLDFTDPDRPEGWSPWRQGDPHDTPKTIRTKNIRALMGLLRFCPNGFSPNSWPYSGSYNTVDNFPTPVYSISKAPLYAGSRVFTDPEQIDWDLYSDDLSRLLSPTNVLSYLPYKKLVSPGVRSGTITQDSEGCQVEGSFCGPPTTIGQTNQGAANDTSVFTDPVFTTITPIREIIEWEKAKIQYASVTDFSLNRLDGRRSLLFYTFNIDTDYTRCPVSKPEYVGSGTIQGKQVSLGCCCLQYPDRTYSSQDDGKSICPAFINRFEIGFPNYNLYTLNGFSGATGPKQGFVKFSKVSSGFPSVNPTKVKQIQTLEYINGIGGCSKPDKTLFNHVQYEAIPQAWWCSDTGAQQLLGVKFSNARRDGTGSLPPGTIVYNLEPKTSWLQGIPAQLPTSSNPPSGAVSVSQTCSGNPECPPGGGSVLVLKYTETRYECIDWDWENTRPDGSFVAIDWELTTKFWYTAPGPAWNCPSEQPSDDFIESFRDFQQSFGTDSDCPEGFWQRAIEPQIWSSCDWCDYEVNISRSIAPPDLLPFLILCSDPNSNEICCHPTDSNLDCSRYLTENLDQASRECVPTEAKGKVLNPFVKFSRLDTPNQTYEALLNSIGQGTEVNKYIVQQTGPFTTKTSYIGTAVQFDAKSYKQSLITNLYGMSLEYGNLSLKSYSPSFENTYGVTLEGLNRFPYTNLSASYNSNFQLYNDTQKFINETTVGNLTTPLVKPIVVNGNTALIRPQWPQATEIPPITKTGNRGLNSTTLAEETHINFIKDILTKRNRKEAPQWSRQQTRPEAPYPAIEQMEQIKYYWDRRIIYELADLFENVDYRDKSVKTPYYPDGIPDLTYSNVKLKLLGDGEVQIIGTPEYKLNWFYNALENMVILSDAG